MAYLLADIDATCAALGLSDGNRYYADREALPCLKHLIWILRRDLDTHEYRRHIGQANILQTDLVPMLISYIDNEEMADVILRLLINLTNPTLLLYREKIPKDVASRRNFVELVDILQRYKEAFADQAIWTVLQQRLQKMLQIEWNERLDDNNLLIERILVLIRNVLQVPANPDAERRSDNDASIHDQVLWSLQKSGILDLVLFILASEGESQFQLHSLEILYLMFREQTAAGLADSALARTEAEKNKDEQELIRIRQYEKAKQQARPQSGRHSRFGGTFVMRNMKSVSEQDMILHQALDKAVRMDFDKEKVQKKRSRFVIAEAESADCSRRSAFSIRLFLREFCNQILDQAYNRFVRQARRLLESNAGGEIGNDHSYLLWAIRFFMEFNRLSEFRLAVVSETLSVNAFHYVLTRIQHDVDIMGTDKERVRVWGKRLNIAVKCFNELLWSMCRLHTSQEEVETALFRKLQNNVFYMLEYREMVLHLLIGYNENHCTRSYLRDVIEMANLFIKMLEKFCKGTVFVQTKQRGKASAKNKNKRATSSKRPPQNEEMSEIDKDEQWQKLVAQISAVLAAEAGVELPEGEAAPLPFDAASEVPIDDQRGDCLLRIHKLLLEEKFEHAILLLRSAREVWPEEAAFGAFNIEPEQELTLLQGVFKASLGQSAGRKSAGVIDEDEEGNHRANEYFNDNEDGDENGEDGEEDEGNNYTEREFNFEDFAKRLVNPKIVRACTMALVDWEQIPDRALKSAVTILHRVAFVFKSPAMLYHAKLFRLFQEVLNAPPTKHAEEFRKLAIYMVRQFVVAQEKNPKIYAELFFWKTIRECNDMESGYEGGSGGGGGGGKKGWSEEQEDELRRLFEENQANPENDNDVIDWMLGQLIDKTRTRRGVMKKLKDLGLHFSKPSRKRVKQDPTWSAALDEELRHLYAEYGEGETPMAHIMAELSDASKSQRMIVNRLMFLGCISGKAQVAPPKRKTKPGARNGEQSDDNDDGDEFEFAQRDDGTSFLKRKVQPKKKPSKANNKSRPMRKAGKKSFNVATAQALIKQLTEERGLADALEWLAEAFEDVAEDLQDEEVDQEDAIPLVPITADQREAVENAEFKALLREFGMQEPLQEMETYWRVPNEMKSDDLKLRIMLLNGEEVDSQLLAAAGIGGDAEGADVNGSGAEDSSDDGDGDEEDVDGERDRINSRNKLLYEGEEEEGEEEEQDVFEALKRRRQQYLAKTAATTSKVQTADDDGEDGKVSKATGSSKQTRSVDESIATQPDDGADTESMRLRLDDLEDSDDDDDDVQPRNIRDGDVTDGVEGDGDDEEFEKENIDGINVTGASSSGGRRKRQQIIDSDSEDETPPTAQSVDPFDAMKGDAATATDQKMASDDEGEAEIGVGHTKRRASKKRERSENDDSDQEEAQLTDKESGAGKVGGGQMKVKRKRIVIADDDED